MLPRLAWILAALPLIRADVKFISPKGGATIDAGEPITVEWEDGDGKTPLADLSGYQIQLVVGGSTDATSQPLPATDGVAGDHSLGKTEASFTPSPKDGPKGTNIYYLRILSTKKKGGQVINYSQRFTLDGMTGKWPTSDIQKAATQAAGSVDAVPKAVDGGAPNPAGGAGDGKDYAMQTGPMRYAPMQQDPPKSITKTDMQPLYPVSAFQVAVTYLPTPEAQTTITASRTAQHQTKENQATPAPLPGDDGSNNAGGSGNNDMAKFLRRWKD